MPSQVRRLVVFAALLSAALAVQAQEFRISGQVNRLLMRVDDGAEARSFQADNVNSQTRLRMTAALPLGDGPTLGAVWETGYTDNPSSRVSMRKHYVAATNNKRHANLYVAGGWGRLGGGRGDGAANGGMESDLSGTTVIQYSGGVTDIGGNFAFRSGTTFGPTVASTIGNLDFESRYKRLRYDTPRFGPVSLAFSKGVKDDHKVHEVAAWYADETARGKLAAALGWSRERKGGAAGDEDTVGGSVSWLAPGGFNLSLALGTSDDETPRRPRRIFAYGKLGYLRGAHAVSADYAEGRDFNLAGDRSRAVGIGYVYTAASWLELYAGAKRHALDRPGADFRPIDFIVVGTRLRF